MLSSRQAICIEDSEQKNYNVASALYEDVTNELPNLFLYPVNHLHIYLHALVKSVNKPNI